MENVKNLIPKQNRNVKHVMISLSLQAFMYTNYVTKIKSISVRTQLDSIYCIQLHVSTYLRASSGPIFVNVTLWDENVIAMNDEYKEYCLLRFWSCGVWCYFSSVFLNRRAAARYRALASIIPGRGTFSWNLSF